MKSKIIGWILDFFIVITIAFISIGGYYIYQIKVLNQSYANIFDYTFFQVATGSMYPTINIGDVVVVKITKEIKENEIIVYKEEESFITHRFIEKKEDKLITRGDANNSKDKPIEIKDVLGKVVLIMPKFGVIREILLQPKIIIIISSIVLVIGFLFVANKKSEENDTNE